MCGIVGVAGDIHNRVRDSIFPDLLDVCQLRGRDSTGVIRVNNRLDYTWVKRVGPPAYLFDSRAYDEVMTGFTSVLIGHCRLKTSGPVTTKTAHPFDYPEQGICGVHNGTIGSYHNLDTYSYDKVDSEVLFGHLAANGPEETFNQLTGAWSCVWWDDNEKTINFIRNKERPMWFTWSEDLKRMYWASEPWMFNAVARKEKLWDGGKDKHVYVELPENTLWRFRINPSPKKDEKIIAMRPPIVIEPKKVEVRSYSGNPHVGFKGGSTDWELNEEGTFVRKDPESPQEHTPPKQGEEAKVTSPFVAATEKVLQEIDGPLNDALPEQLQSASTPGGGATTQRGTVEFLRHSLKSSTSLPQDTSSATSKKNILSLPNSTSKTSLPKSRGASSKASKQSPNVFPFPSKLVDFRNVRGTEYITDCRNKNEYSAKQFEENTDGKCCFCKKPIGSLKEVAVFKNEKEFVCTDCISEPNAAVC